MVPTTVVAVRKQKKGRYMYVLANFALTKCLNVQVSICYYKNIIKIPGKATVTKQTR